MSPEPLMMQQVFDIQRGINRPMEFKGIRAQYLLYLVLGLITLLMLFAILYLAGCSIYFILPVTGTLGTALFYYVTRYSKKYATYGLMKAAAYRKLPKAMRGARPRLMTNTSTIHK